MTKTVDWQRKRIFKLAGQMGLDNDMLHSHLLVIADKDSIKNLHTKKQIALLIASKEWKNKVQKCQQSNLII